MPPFIYWVYFDGVGQPEKIIVRNFIEFQNTLMKIILEHQDMPEWICRGYK